MPSKLYPFVLSVALLIVPSVVPSVHGKTVESVVDLLKDPQLNIQSDAMFTLKKMGRRAIPYLKKVIRSDHPAQRWRSQLLLAMQGDTSMIPLFKENIGKTREPEYVDLCRASFHGLGYVGGAPEVAYLITQEDNTHCPNASQMTHLALYNIAKRNLALFLKGIYLYRPSFKVLEPIERFIFQHLSLTTGDILNLLKSPDPILQAGALYLVRKIKATHVESLFKDGLRHSHPAVNIQAVLGIRDYTVTSLLPRLLPILKKSNHPILTTSILTTLSSLTAHLAETSKFELEQHLLTLLKGPNSDIQPEVIRALGTLKSTQASKPIYTKLSSLYRSNKAAYSDTHLNALLYYIGRVPNKTSLKYLRDYVNHPKHAATVIESMLEMKVDGILSYVKAALSNPSISNSAKRMVISSLLRHRPPGTAMTLVPYLHVTYDFQKEVLQGLIDLEPPFLEKIVVSFISHTHRALQRIAIRGAAKIGSSKSVNALIQLLSHSDPGLTLEAIESLRQIRDRRAVRPIILVMMGSKNSTIIERSLIALRDLKDATALEYVRLFLKHDNSKIRQLASNAVKTLTSL